MGQHLYFCTFTHTSPPGYNSRDGMQAARKAGSGLGAALCRQQALQGSRPEASGLQPPGREGPSVRPACCVPLARGCILARVPTVSWPIGPSVWLWEVVLGTVLTL